MTDEQREKLEAMKATLDSLLGHETGCPSGWHIARVVRGRHHALAPYPRPFTYGDLIVVMLPKDEDGDYRMLTASSASRVAEANLKIICSIEDALAAWEEKENKDD